MSHFLRSGEGYLLFPQAVHKAKKPVPSSSQVVQSSNIVEHNLQVLLSKYLVKALSHLVQTVLELHTIQGGIH